MFIPIWEIGFAICAAVAIGTAVTAIVMGIMLEKRCREAEEKAAFYEAEARKLVLAQRRIKVGFWTDNRPEYNPHGRS